MENYKSIHTGEQIDAAIAQVLTKNFPFSIVATANDVHLPSLENGQHIFIQDENKLYRYKNSTLVEDAINYIQDLGWFGSEEQAYAAAAAYDDYTKEYIYKDKRILFAEFPIPEQPDVNKTEKVIILQNTSYHRTAQFLFKDGKFYLRHLGWDMDGVYLNPTWIETLPSHLAWDDETHTLSLKQWGETINEEQQIPLADAVKAGLMSKEDKVKLDGIAKQANNYSLPAASSSTRGGIKIGYASSANNRAVQLSSEKAYVYIPNATTIQSGLMSKEDKVKLDTMTTEISNTYATKASLNNKVDKVSGKQLSSEDFTTALKTRLEGINVYKHAFNALSALPDSGDGWYSIINLGDMESAIVQISAGQSDTQVAVSAGWGGNDIGSLAVLNCTLDVNNNYAHIKAVRIRRHKANNNDANGYLMLEAKLNRTGYTNSYRNTVVSVFTNAGHNPIVIDSNATNVLQLNSSTSEILLQEFELEDRTIMAKAINVETINLKGYSLEDVSKYMHCSQSNPNMDFSITDNNCNCYGYVGTLQNMNISEESIIIDSISAYVREQGDSPNSDTDVWCRLLRYTNDAWEIVYQSTKSKPIKGLLPKTLFTFNMEKVSDNYIINNTDRIAVTYVNSETADVLSGVQLGFKTVDKQGGLLNVLTNTSAGMHWSPALVFNYLPLSKAAISGDYNDLNNKPTIPAAQVNSDWNAASGKAQILNKPTIPTNLSDLSSDTTHRTVTDTEKQTWNNKSNFSGSYNDLTNKPSIPSAITEATVTDWGFTKNTGTYSKPSTGIPKSDLHTDVQNALNKATTALQTHQDISGKQDVISDLETIRQGAAKGATALQSYEEQYKGTVTGVTINGETKTPTNGIVNIGTVITNHQDISGKQDTLVSGVNIKTINGESIIGSGNVDLSNYATIEHVNTQIGNINSILTSIINQ